MSLQLLAAGMDEGIVQGKKTSLSWHSSSPFREQGFTLAAVQLQLTVPSSTDGTKRALAAVQHCCALQMGQVLSATLSGS